MTGLDWPVCIQQLVTEPIVALTSPLYKLQRKGERSVDGLGWVWQCNVFGHYVMVGTHLIDSSCELTNSRPRFLPF